jgi:hypothetical protein
MEGSDLPPGAPAQVAPARYSNGVLVNATPWDISIEFQHLTVVGTADNSAPEVDVQTVARIVMSPQHARLFQDVLTGVVAQWEEQHGKLPDPNANGGRA